MMSYLRRTILGNAHVVRGNAFDTAILMVKNLEERSMRESVIDAARTSLAAVAGYISTPAASACSPSHAVNLPRRTR